MCMATHMLLQQIYAPIIFGCDPVRQFRLDKDEWISGGIIFI